MSASGSVDPCLEQGQDHPDRRHPRKWLVVPLLMLVGLILALTPPLLNVNRYKKRIAASMSQSLGRPVRLDSVSLHLLPVPGFTLGGLDVTEDPHFGSEPTIRAVTVEVTLRPSSLWRRQVEFSRIRFVDPSLNLVRDAQGKWNIESLLMHASQVDTAPTAQSHAGPAPRFPYVEATGARVNVKMGAEKMPYSLTDADFALWLPSARQWRVRLEARPARTDSNITDSGTLRVEGSLQRAQTLAAVPVDLILTWRDAQMGEASRIFTGQDAEWRGTLHVDVAMSGLLGNATLRAHATVNELRRAAFLPERPIDLSVHCTAELDTMAAALSDAVCTMPTPTAQGFDQPGAVEVRAQRLAADTLHPGALTVTLKHVPDNYVLEWTKLFSQRMQKASAPDGAVSASGKWMPADAGQPGWWDGTAQGELPPASTANTLLAAPSVEGNAQGFALRPVNLAPAGKPPLVISALATRDWYSFTLAGTATPDQLRGWIALAPPLGDGLAQAVPGLIPDAVRAPGAAASAAVDREGAPVPAGPVDATCSRSWGGPQTCVAIAAPSQPTVRSHHRAR